MLSPRDEGLLLELSRVVSNLARDSVSGDDDCSELVVIAAEASLILATVIRMAVNEGNASALVQMLGVLQDFSVKYVPPKPGRLYGDRFRTNEEIQKRQSYQLEYYHNKKKLKEEVPCP